MIIDTLQNHRKYHALHKNFSLAFDFLERFISNPLQAGNYEIMGEEVFALVQEYRPKEEARLESHMDYIDIQFIAFGNEKMECIDIKKCEVSEDLTPDKDVIFYSENKDVSTLVLGMNAFAIFFPNDVHKPGLFYESDQIKKIIVKVRI